MKLQVKQGYSLPLGDVWVKIDVDAELDDKEIANPKLYNIEAKIAKGIRILNPILDKHINDYLNATKKKVGGF